MRTDGHRSTRRLASGDAGRQPRLSTRRGRHRSPGRRGPQGDQGNHRGTPHRPPVRPGGARRGASKSGHDDRRAARGVGFVRHVVVAVALGPRTVIGERPRCRRTRRLTNDLRTVRDQSLSYKPDAPASAFSTGRADGVTRRQEDGNSSGSSPYQPDCASEGLPHCLVRTYGDPRWRVGPVWPRSDCG